MNLIKKITTRDQWKSLRSKKHPKYFILKIQFKFLFQKAIMNETSFSCHLFTLLHYFYFILSKIVRHKP